MEITKELAAQIVTAIYEVVKRDIIFIDVYKRQRQRRS